MCVFSQAWRNNSGSPLSRPAGKFASHSRRTNMTAGPMPAFGRAAAAAVLLMIACESRAQAAEVRLLSAAAMQSVFKNIAGEFERTASHKLIISYGTIGAIAQRIQGGETAD